MTDTTIRPEAVEPVLPPADIQVTVSFSPSQLADIVWSLIERNEDDITDNAFGTEDEDEAFKEWLHSVPNNELTEILFRNPECRQLLETEIARYVVNDVTVDAEAEYVVDNELKFAKTVINPLKEVATQKGVFQNIANAEDEEEETKPEEVVSRWEGCELQLKLARSFDQVGDMDGMRAVLHSVILLGDETQRSIAQEMIGNTEPPVAARDVSRNDLFYAERVTEDEQEVKIIKKPSLFTPSVLIGGALLGILATLIVVAILLKSAPQ